MGADSIHARVEQRIGELRARFPQITACHSALVRWSEGGAARHSLHLDVRWPQHQEIVSGPAAPTAEAAIEAGLSLAAERIRASLSLIPQEQRK